MLHTHTHTISVVDPGLPAPSRMGTLYFVNVSEVEKKVRLELIIIFSSYQCCRLVKAVVLLNCGVVVKDVSTQTDRQTDTQVFSRLKLDELV